MNILTGLGYFLTGIGILVLFAALFIGTTAYDAVSGIPNNPNTGNQLGQAAFLAAFTPYGVTSGVLMSLGVVFAIVANSRKPNDESATPSGNVSTLYGNELPLPNQGICPSCEYPTVYIEKYQRWYCVNERKYI